MAMLADLSRPLQEKVRIFDTLRVREDTEQRKAIVRDLENDVKSGKVSITDDQMQGCLAGDKPLARILVHLLVENGRGKAEPEAWRVGVQTEWELLRRHGFGHDTSLGSLYYAIRAYLTRLRNAPELKARRIDDRALFEQIEKALSQTGLDDGKHTRDRIAEILALLEAEAKRPSDTISAARIARRGVVIAAIIALIGALGVGIMTHWDKLFKATSTGTTQVTPGKKK
jgi:hypothetical protein